MIRKLALSVALATCASSVFALGLGEIKLTSGLNQPLKAEIPLLSADDVDLDKLITVLASQGDFERVGVERLYFLTKIKFTAKQRANGKKYIEVTTRESVKDPFVNFLLELNWPQGRLLKEYTLLLDPPVYSQQIKKSPIKVAEKKTAVKKSDASSKNTKKTASTKKTTHQAAKPPASFVSQSSRTYGPTRSTDTLWGIAKKFSKESNVSLHRLMVAIFRANPHAFIGNNMNNLKKGQMLTIPTDQEIADLNQQSALKAIVKHNSTWSATENEQSPGMRPNAASTKDDKGAVGEGETTALPEESKKDFTGRLKLLPPSEDATKLLSSEAKNTSADGLKVGEYSEGQQIKAETVQAIADLKTENSQLRNKNDDLQRQIDELNTKLDSLLKVQNIDLARLEAAAKKSNEAVEASSEDAAQSTESAAIDATATTDTVTATDSVTAPVTDGNPDTSAQVADNMVNGETPDTESTAANTSDTNVDAAAEVVSSADPTQQDNQETIADSTKTSVTPKANEVAKPKSDAPVVKDNAEMRWDQVENFDDALVVINQFIKKQPYLPYYVGAGVAVLLLLLFLLLRKRKSDDDYYEEPDFDAAHEMTLKAVADQAQSGSDKSVSQQIDSLDPDMPILSAGSDSSETKTMDVASSDETVADPLAEADIYIAYGRYNQAEKLLTEAHEYEPERVDIALKLLECYAQSNDQSAYEALAAEMYPNVKDMGDVVAEISGLYSSKWPDGQLAHYSASESVDAGVKAQTSTVNMSDLSPEFAALAGDDFLSSLNKPQAKTAEPEPKDDEPAPLEFDLSDSDFADKSSKKESDMPSLDFGDDGELDLFGAAADEASTKLDLARAYIDMGDLDGAKEILLEVTKEGNSKQQQDAQALLDKM